MHIDFCIEQELLVESHLSIVVIYQYPINPSKFESIKKKVERFESILLLL